MEVSEVPLPILKENELMMKIAYSACNRADIMQRKGGYAPPPGASNIIGLECAGYILSDPKDLDSYKGQPLSLALLPGGGYGS